MKKFVIAFFLIIFVFIFIPTMISFLPVANFEPSDYTLPNSEVTFQIESDGRVFVTERIHYNLNRCFNELYLSKPENLAIYNASGFCENAQCSFRTEEPYVSISGGRELILSLETNNCNSNPIANFNYEIHPIILCEDTARFYYQCWGMEWDRSTDLTVTIIFPEAIDNKEYYVHPWDLDYSVVFENVTTIIFKSKQKPGIPLEVDMLLPKNIFEGSTYFTTSDKSRETIISFEEKSRSDAEFYGSIMPILSFFITSLPFLLFATCYFLFGKEREVPYTGIYEREPPSDHTPAEVSTMLNQFRIQPSAFIATILDFVYRGYFEMSETTVEKMGIFGKENVNTLVFTKKKGPEKLKPHEWKVYDYVCKNMTNGSVSLEKLKRKVRSSKFANLFLSWKRKVILDLDRKKYLETRGVIIFSISSAVYLIFCLALFSVQLPKTTFQNLMLISVEPALTQALIVGTIISIVLIIIANVWKTILSRWTEEGRLLELKWKNFKKFISDFTLLKEHPPESIALWDFYMVYAVALGVADNTIKAMKDIVPDEEIRNIRTGTIVYSAASFSSINSFTSSVRSSGGSGGGGGGGGGFGGGGGGGGGAR
ncbi:MAG: hypothetical protein DRP84_11300 [Spirochaetes bacterium]|nr:MAG: hypothetical protein DRP84_11300 [Spirochaetota bacterium]